MTPEQLEAIRERATGRPDGGMKTGPSSSWRQATNDRRALLAYVDTLERLNKGLRGVAGRALHDRARLTDRAANLLAHQQARGIEALFTVGFVAGTLDREISTLRAENERLRVKIEHLRAQLYEEREAADRADEAAESLRAENERKDAEIERLKALLAKTHEAWTWEANQGDGIDERHGPLWEAARYAITGICTHCREDMSRCRTCEDAVAALGAEREGRS